MSQPAQPISEAETIPLTIVSAALTTTSTSSVIGTSRNSNANAATSVSSPSSASNGTSGQLTNVALSSSLTVQKTDNSNSNSNGDRIQRYNSISDENRYCWVCFANDEDDEFAAWVQPCRCSGTTKWYLNIDCFSSPPSSIWA